MQDTVHDTYDNEENIWLSYKVQHCETECDNLRNALRKIFVNLFTRLFIRPTNGIYQRAAFVHVYTLQCTMYNQQMVATLYVFSIPTEQLSVSVKFTQ